MPNNINWTNITYSWIKRLFRQIFSIVCAVFVLCFNFALVIASSYFQNKLNEDFNTEVECHLISEPTVAEVQIEWNDVNLSDKAKIKSFCFCKDLLFSGSFLDTKDYKLPDGSQPCNVWMDNYIRVYILSLAIIVVIPIINAILNIILRYLTDFERLKSKSETIVGNVWKIFLMTFINTVLILILVNMSIQQIKDSWTYFPILTGDHSDFNSKWFTEVGVTIMMSMFVEVLTPHLSVFLEYLGTLLIRCFDSCCDGGKTITKMSNKVEYLNLYVGPEFPIDIRISEMLVNAFIGITFSCCMPVLLFSTAAYFIITYYLDKYLFVRYYRRPPNYDSKFVKFFLWIVFLGIICHCVFAIWIFGNSSYFSEPSQSLFPSVIENIKTLFASDGNTLFIEIWLRVTTFQCLLIVFFLLLIFLISFFHVVIIKSLAQLFKCLVGLGDEDEDENAFQIADSYFITRT